MKLWLDAQLSPRLAHWLADRFRLEVTCVRDVGLRDAGDEEIYLAAREANAVVMTKDHDFVVLLQRLGPPPRVLWITSGNTSNVRLRAILEHVLVEALRLLEAGEPLVEIGMGDAAAK